MIIPTPPAGYPPTTDSSSWMGGGMPPAAPPSGPAQPEPPRTKRGRRKDKTGAPEGEQVTKKVVNRQFRFALILGAVVLALGSFIALGANTPALYVVRTVAEIPPGALVNPATHLAAYPVQDDADAEAGAITAATADAAMDLAVEFTEGKRSQFPLAEGEQVHKDDFATTWPTLTPLEPTERLMSITATASAAVAGQSGPVTGSTSRPPQATCPVWCSPTSRSWPSPFPRTSSRVSPRRWPARKRRRQPTRPPVSATPCRACTRSV